MRARLFMPVEELRDRIGLIIVLAFWKHRHLVEVFGEPGSGLGDADKAVLDQRGLRVQTHDLIGGRLVAGDTVAALGDQLLYQLGAGGLVLDQHDIRVEQALLRAHRAFERRIFEPAAEYGEEKELFALYPQVVHTEKSLSSVALLAVSQLCTMRST